VVIDLANSPSFEDKAVLEFFETSGRNLFAAESAAGVRHHVALSIVGTDRMPDNGYFRAKVAHEKLIAASGIPYTIVRSTQFMEFIERIAGASTDGSVVKLSPGLFQPIAADDVAAIVAEVALAAPRNGILEIAGPDRAPLSEIAARYLEAVGDPRRVSSDPEARYSGGRVEERSLVPLGDARLGSIRFAEWLRRRPAAGPRAGNASPARATRMIEGSFEGVGGVKIFTREWQPAGRAHGVVVISHGLNAHSGLYEWAAQQLTGNGLAVYALDHRGRGRSEGERFFVNKYTDWTTDLATFIDSVKLREPGLPVFLLGHSAGGVIACCYALEHQDELAGLICEDFAYQVPAPAVALALVKGVSHIAPRAHVMKLKNEDFSRDPAVVAALNADPLIANEAQPSETVAELIRADELLKKSFGRITLPLLILHGTADKVTKPSGSKEFYEKAGSSDKTLKLYEGHFHDLLADVGKQQVMADIVAWIDAHLGAAVPRSGRELRT
jgi:alpha-beta hydrolase superfamily lysophospholipase